MALSKVLESADELPWNEALYLPKGKSWTLDSPSLVYSPDDCDEGEDEPELARQNGLKYALGMTEVQDIVANAKAQKPGCHLEQLLEALLFYYKNDAFIVLK